jgi:hypothetical protein
MAFNIILSTQTKRRNSTARVGETGTTVSVVLKDRCSYISPIFELQGMGNPTGYNYCYVPNFNAFYFIDDWEYFQTRWIAHCSMDYLGTFRADIHATTAYALYSDSAGNANIVDNRISGEYVNNYYMLAEGTAFWVNGLGDWYIVRVIGDNGGISGYVLSRQKFDDFIAALGGNLTFDTTAALQYADAIGCVVGATHFPITPSGNTYNYIHLGVFNTGIYAQYVDYITSGSVILSWNRIFGDWRDSVFVNYSLWLPFVGTVSLAASDIGGLSSIGIYYTVDWIGGGIMYKIYMGTARTATFNGVIGNSVPVTGYMSNALGAVGGVVDALGSAAGAVGAAATGNAAAAISGAVDAIGSAAGAALAYKQKTASIIGGTTGCAFAGADATVIRLSAVATIASDTPTNIKSAVGLPAMKSLYVGHQSGYLQTAGFSVGGSATAEIKDRINSAMDSGVFIE